jgi:hypothetical protein
LQGHFRPDLSGFKANHSAFNHNSLKFIDSQNGTAVALCMVPVVAKMEDWVQ